MNYALSIIDFLYLFSIRVSVVSIQKIFALTKNEESVVVLPPPTDTESSNDKTFRSVQQILRRDAHREEHIGSSTMYVQSIQAPLYRNPTIAFDTIVTTIPYGETVTVQEPKGRFFKVSWREQEGWILREDVVHTAMDVHPDFIVSSPNFVDTPNTSKVRSIIQDPFGLSRSEFPLQAGEYVLYRLWKRGIRIEQWSSTQPRIPGTWHNLLKGKPHVHMSVMPRSGAIMEYILHDDIGHLAYVEAVFPEDTIQISEVNIPDSGIYNERLLTKDEWKELRPVFIYVR